MTVFVLKIYIIMYARIVMSDFIPNFKPGI